MNPLPLVILSIAACLAFSTSGQTSDQQEKSHVDGVDERGDKAMGFSHEMTSHHFLLFRNGGAIEIEADNPSDSVSKEAIRNPFVQIATMFSRGDFQLPLLIHATVPTGVDTMKRLAREIAYSAEVTSKGARVLITTQNSEALKAIHDFLRFQITDHRTNDSLEVRG